MSHTSLSTYAPAWIGALKPGDQVDLVIPSIVGIYATLTVFLIEPGNIICAGRDRSAPPSRFKASGVNVEGLAHGILVPTASSTAHAPSDHDATGAPPAPAWLAYIRPGDPVILNRRDTPSEPYCPGIVLRRVTGGYLDVLDVRWAQILQFGPDGKHSWRHIELVADPLPTALSEIRALHHHLSAVGAALRQLGAALVLANRDGRLAGLDQENSADETTEEEVEGSDGN